MLRFIDFILSEAGQVPERQEIGFISAINQAVKDNKNSPITVTSGDEKIQNVIGAEKYSGRQQSGSEPYTDVVVKTTSGELNLSMKGSKAPSLAGGGLSGIEAIIPGIGDKFMELAYHNHINKGLKSGDKIPDTYAKLNNKDKLLLVIGNASIGGPINFMYIGPMDVKSSFSNGILNVNGKITDAVKFANEHDLYFRLRARREDQRFDPDAVTKSGVHKIYGKSPSKGDSAGRLVVTDSKGSATNLIDL